MFSEDYELPYFDDICNDYAREINRQDSFQRRGGRLSAPQMIKYDNRVAMLVERLVLILEAVKADPEALRDYLGSIEFTRKKGWLPVSVYKKFMEKMEKPDGGMPSLASERDRDRTRVIRGNMRMETSSLSDLPMDELLKKYEEKAINKETLFHQFRRRERAGMKLQRMDPDLWGSYKSWNAEKRRRRRSIRENER